MTSRDTIRLLKIDKELADIEELVEESLASEDRMQRTTFLRSRVYKVRYEKLLRSRANFIKTCNIKYTREQTYQIVLAQRLEAANLAYEALEVNAMQIMQAPSTMLVGDIEENKLKYRKLLEQNKILRLVYGNKERAVSNWLMKDKNRLPTTLKAHVKLVAKELEPVLGNHYRDCLIDDSLYESSSASQQEILDAIKGYKSITESQEVTEPIDTGETPAVISSNPFDFLGAPAHEKESARTRVNINAGNKEVEVEVDDIQIQESQNESK